LPLAIYVALAGPGGRAFMPLGVQVLAQLQLHQRLTQHAHALTQEIGVLLQIRLAKQIGQCHP
jgi:hypothetical protein